MCIFVYVTAVAELLVDCAVDLSGKYIKDGEEMQSSEETRAEEAQAKLWELSAGTECSTCKT